MVGNALSVLLPLILFAGALWLVGKIKPKWGAAIVMFIATYALAESPLGRAVWDWLAGIAKAAGLHNIHL